MINIYGIFAWWAIWGSKKAEKSTLPVRRERAIVVGSIGYHLRRGPHAIATSDWRHDVDLSNQSFRK